jgi:CheY-like chemotaxis protein
MNLDVDPSSPIIAVINDDTVFLTLMGELLADEGYRTTVMRSTDDAYQRVRAEKPDLVVLDIRIGHEERGWAVLELLRLDPLTAAIPVIICSTDGRLLADKADKLMALRCVPLEKPFNVSDLLNLVRNAIDSSASCAAD